MKQTTDKLILFTLGIGLSITTPKIAYALNSEVNQQPQKSNSGELLAQIYTGDRRMISVVGQGQASLPADIAQIQFFFNKTGPGPGGKAPAEITEATMKPIVDALVKAGVPANAIRVEINPQESRPYGPPPQGGRMLVELTKPTRGRLRQIISLVETTNRNTTKFYMNPATSLCGVNDFSVLENAARQSALNNALNRAKGVAAATNVQLGDILSVMEFPSFGSAFSPCDSQSVYRPFGRQTKLTPFNPSAPAEVQIETGVITTYSIKQ